MKALGHVAGTALTDNSADAVWTLPKTNEYKLTLDTTSDAGGKGVPIIQIEVYKASLTVYIDTEISAKA